MRLIIGWELQTNKARSYVRDLNAALRTLSKLESGHGDTQTIQRKTVLSAGTRYLATGKAGPIWWMCLIKALSMTGSCSCPSAHSQNHHRLSPLRAAFLWGFKVKKIRCAIYTRKPLRKAYSFNLTPSMSAKLVRLISSHKPVKAGAVYRVIMMMAGYQAGIWTGQVSKLSS